MLAVGKAGLTKRINQTGITCGVYRKGCASLKGVRPAGYPQRKPIRDNCLEHSKIKVLKMLDLQTKSAIDSTEPPVLL